MKPKGVVRLLHGRSTQFAKFIILYQNDSSWIIAIIESWNMFKAQTSGQSLKILCSSRNNKHLFEIPCQWMRIVTGWNLQIERNYDQTRRKCRWKCTWSNTQSRTQTNSGCTKQSRTHVEMQIHMIKHTGTWMMYSWECMHANVRIAVCCLQTTRRWIV